MTNLLTTMTSLSDRIRQIRLERFGECGASLLAEGLGLPVRTWLSYEAGVTIPGPILLAFINFARVNSRWLLTGEGEPTRRSRNSRPTRDKSGLPNRTIESESATHLLTELAHDVRTPLSSMLITLELLELKHADRFDSEDHADLATLRVSIQSILDLHDGILRHAGPPEGRVASVETEFAVDEMLAACAEIIRPLAAKKGLAVVLEPGACPVIRSDRPLIQRLVGNLLSNAVHYTERGSIVLRNWLDGQCLWIEVEDTGIGIAPKDCGRIFDEYFRVAPADGDGRGLGLAMARRMAKSLGGSLNVTSKVGRGSIFSLSLPACIPTPVPSAGRSLAYCFSGETS